MRFLDLINRIAFLCLVTIVLATIAPPRLGPVARANDEPSVSQSTAEMAALLRRQADLVDADKLEFLVNDRRAELMGERLARQRPSPDRMVSRFMFGRELLHAGRTDDAVRAFQALREDLKSYGLASGNEYEHDLLAFEALGHLRMAEQQNCCLANNRDSCLLPIAGEGIHRRREGATRAAETLQTILGRHPDDLRARWLLNVAHMTLGSYPGSVPKDWLIPPSAFASEYPLPRFDNVARDVGLDIFGLAGGAILDDFNNDGRLDVMLSGIGFEEQTRVFMNTGDGRFHERTDEAGLRGLTGGLNMIQADYDNDGFVDVLILRGGWMGTEGRFPLSLLRNQGDGTFTDVTKAAGLLRFAPTQTATWLDYDGDGRLDLFIGNESPGDLAHPCELFHNNGDGTFTNVARSVGVDFVGFVKGVTSGDYDNDGRPDLYVSVNGGDNLLFHNEGPQPGGGWRFVDTAKTAGVTEPRVSFGTLFFDYDNDGWQDLWVTGYGMFAGESMATGVAADYLGLPTTAERGRLYRNRGDGTFADVTKQVGLYKVVPTMGLNFGDLDHDGFLDLYLATGNPDFGTLIPNRMFRNDGGRAFQDVTTAGNFGHLQKGHAVAFGDVDNDGDQDVLSQMGGAYTADQAYTSLYENPGHTNRWIGLELEGVRSNRKAIGARVTVTVKTPQGPAQFHRVVSSGGSFGGAPLRQQVGIGDARQVTSVTVFWPATGRTQEITGLEPRRWYRIREGDATAQVLARPRFALASHTRKDARTKTAAGSAH